MKLNIKKILTAGVSTLCIGAVILGATLVNDTTAYASVTSVDVTPITNKNVTQVSDDEYDVVFNATVSPSYATNKKLTWSLSYENPNSDFAIQYDISDVATLSVSEDTHSATVNVNTQSRYDNVSETYKSGLGEVIVVTATSQENDMLMAMSTIGYANRLSLGEDDTFMLTGLKLSAFGKEIPVSIYAENFVDSVIYVDPGDATTHANYHVISTDCKDWYTTYADYYIGYTRTNSSKDYPRASFSRNFLEDLDSLYRSYMPEDYFISNPDEGHNAALPSDFGVIPKVLYNDHTGFNVYNSIYKGLCQSLYNNLSGSTSEAYMQYLDEFYDYLVNEYYCSDLTYPIFHVESSVTNGYVNYEYDYYMTFDCSVQGVSISNGPVVI